MRHPPVHGLSGRWIRSARCVVAVFLLGCWGWRSELLAPPAHASEDEGENAEPETLTEASTLEGEATIRVRGYGLLGNRRLLQNLRVLRPEEGGTPLLDANTVEDAAMLLLGALRGEGYLRPRLDVELHLEDGSLLRYPAEDAEHFEVDSSVRVREAIFRVHPGVYYTFDSVTFEGLSAMSPAEAREFFLVADFVLRQRKTRVFTQGRLRRGLNDLQEELARLGYADAAVTSEALQMDHETGLVNVRVGVVEGRRHLVRVLREQVRDDEGQVVARRETNVLREPYSRLWEQQIIRELKAAEYAAGYPDVAVTLEPVDWREGPLESELEVRATIDRGPRITVGRITYEGLSRTQERVLRRRTRLGVGDLLDPLQVEESRFQMLRLGVFDRVDVGYKPLEQEEGKREIEFAVRESRPISLSVLAGYGSYELLRGGLEFEQVDLWGLAHRQRLLAVQSFKSSKAEYAYTIPQAFDAWGDVSANAYYRRREETTFVRRDYGGSLGYNRYVAALLTDVGLRYNYERLETEDENFNDAYGLQQANVSSLALTLDHNRSDNPLYPLKGYRLYGTAEWASDKLAGGVNFGRFEVGASLHVPLSRLLIVHAGVAHSAVVTPGSVAEDLPFNRRFFLGGATSIRGFTQGEAASRDETGKLVGDESTVVGHLELEQRLTDRWSLVGLIDAAGLARDIEDYPLQDTVVSVGGGVRFRSPVGPLRLEYAHNVKRRSEDDEGTLHFSIGYPF